MTYEEEKRIEDLVSLITPHWGAIPLATIFSAIERQRPDVDPAEFENAVRGMLARSRGGAHPGNCNLYEWIESRKPSRSKGELYHMHKILLERKAACPDLAENTILEELCPLHGIDPVLARDAIRTYRAAHPFNHKVRKYSETTYLPSTQFQPGPSKHVEKTTSVLEKGVQAFERWRRSGEHLGRYEKRRHDALVDPSRLEHWTTLCCAEINRGLNFDDVICRVYSRNFGVCTLELIGALVDAVKTKLSEKAAKAT